MIAALMKPGYWQMKVKIGFLALATYLAMC